MCGGERHPPKRKTWTSRDSPLNVRTCCCSESMETSLYHNDGSHLNGVIADDAAWQHSWRRLAAQSASWYATPSGAVGRRFTAILVAEWRGVLLRSWNSERPLVFAHVMLTKTLGVRRAQEIRARITRCMDLWERRQHAGLVGDAEAEGAARKGRATFSGEE